MAILPIVEVPDPRLRQISTPVEEVTDDVRKLIADMFETMYAAPGIGLAAIQAGVPTRTPAVAARAPQAPRRRVRNDVRRARRRPRRDPGRRPQADPGDRRPGAGGGRRRAGAAPARRPG